MLKVVWNRATGWGYHDSMSMVFDKKEALTRLCERRGVRELYLFGSAAEGTFEPSRSDYDFLVRFFPCAPAEHADRYLGLLEDLQDLLGARIDLIEIDAIKNDYFRRETEATRVPLYAA